MSAKIVLKMFPSYQPFFVVNQKTFVSPTKERLIFVRKQTWMRIFLLCPLDKCLRMPVFLTHNFSPPQMTSFWAKLEPITLGPVSTVCHRLAPRYLENPTMAKKKQVALMIVNAVYDRDGLFFELEGGEWTVMDFELHTRKSCIAYPIS